MTPPRWPLSSSSEHKGKYTARCSTGSSGRFFLQSESPRLCRGANCRACFRGALLTHEGSSQIVTCPAMTFRHKISKRMHNGSKVDITSSPQMLLSTRKGISFSFRVSKKTGHVRRFIGIMATAVIVSAKSNTVCKTPSVIIYAQDIQKNAP